jgi:hypothetical protein
MKKILIFLVLLLNKVSAQNLDLKFSNHLQEVSSNSANATLEFDNKNLIIFGSFSSLLDFNPNIGTDTLNTLGNTLFFSFYDSSGNYQYSKHFKANTTSSRCNGVMLKDRNENLIFAGNFKGSVDFDPSTTIVNLNSYNANIFTPYFTKLDKVGNYIWAKKFAGSGFASLSSAAVDSNSNIYISGSFKDTIDFDPELSINNKVSLGNQNPYICKLDSNGSLLWVKHLISDTTNQVSKIISDHNGNLWVCGMLRKSINFDDGFSNFTLTATPNYRQRFLAKYDANGTFLFAKKFSTTVNNSITSAAIDHSNNIILVGNIDTFSDFSLGGATNTINATNESAFVLKLDSNANTIWVAPILGKATCFLHAFNLAVDTLNNITFIGFGNNDSASFYSANYTDSITTSFPAQSTYIASYDSNGQIQYAKTLNPTGANDFQILGLHFGLDNGLHVTGFNLTTNNISLNNCAHVIVGNNSTNMFMAKYNNCIVKTSLDTINECGSILFDGHYYFSDTLIIKTFQSVNCCDSIVKTLLYIDPLNDTIISLNNTLTALANNLSYQWFDCQTNTIIQGANSNTYTPLQNGTYAVIITTATCIDTSNCISISNLSVQNKSPNAVPYTVQVLDDYLHINLTTIAKLHLPIAIYTSTGVLLQTLPYYSNSNIAIPIKHIAPGIYFLKVANYCKAITIH